MLRSAASPGSRGVGRFRSGLEWPPRKTVPGRPLFSSLAIGLSSNKKGHRRGGALLFCEKEDLLDLAFLELDMLARDRIVFLHRQLVGHGARILLRHVEEARVGGADELDLDGGGLGHGGLLTRKGSRGPATAAMAAN